jgi:copper chaperone CopZ
MKNLIGYTMGLAAVMALPFGLISGDCGKAGASCPVSTVSAAAACGAELVSGTASAACESKTVSLASAACGAQPVSGVAKTACCADAGLKAAACGAEPVSGVAEGEACPAGAVEKLAFAQYKVKGMSCGACEGKLKGALEKVAGVSEPKACAQSGMAKLSYDAKKVKKQDLVGAIRSAGFTVEGEVVELKLEGVDCGGCTSEVSKALSKAKGVKEHKVSHETKRAVVTFDPSATCVDSLVAAIGQSGFKAMQ